MDQRQAGPLLLAVLPEDLDGLAQEALRLVEPALAPAQRRLEIQHQGALQRIPRAGPQMVVGPVERLAGAREVGAEAPRLGDVRPGARPQVVEAQLPVEAGVEPVGQIQGQPGEPLALGLPRQPLRLALVQQRLEQTPGAEAGIIAEHDRLPLGGLPRQLGEQESGLRAFAVETDLPLAQMDGAALQGLAVVGLRAGKTQELALPG